MKKIKLTANWDSFENILNRLLLQFKTPEIDLSNIEFVSDNSFDFCVCFNYFTEVPSSEKKYFVFPHEPNWAGTHQKVFSNTTTVFGFDKNNYTGKCIETLAHTFYGGRGPWVDSLDVWNYDYLKNTEFEKTKNISSCITALNYGYGLYKKRFNLLNNLIPNNKIDFYGCTSLIGSNIKPSPYKFDSVSSYRFSLAIENDFHKNWLTEKFYDAILTDCIPIYYGCSNIKEIYPEEGYILLDDIEDVDNVKKTITEILNNSEDIYKQKLPFAKKIKERYFKEYNLLKKIITLD